MAGFGPTLDEARSEGFVSRSPRPCLHTARFHGKDLPGTLVVYMTAQPTRGCQPQVRKCEAAQPAEAQGVHQAVLRR